MMEALEAVDPWRLAFLFLYLGAAFLLMLRLRLTFVGEAFWGALRAAAQLAVMGSVLLFVFEVDRLPLSLALLALMIVVAAWTAARRANVWNSTLAFSMAVMLTTTVIIVLPMVLVGVFEPRPSFLIPISGMVIGNAMNATALALERLQSDLAARRDRIEGYLALGIDPDTATRASAESTLNASLIPSLNSLKTTGVVHIPGMMTGMMIAGQHPMKAAEMQLTILYLIFVAALLSSLMVTHLGRRLYFTRMEALRLPRPSADRRSGRNHQY